MRGWIKFGAGGLAVLGLGGMLFAWSGVVNIAASSGHWDITAWFLHYVMRQSVKTHSIGIEAPPLGDIALAQRGAGHFETGCAPCHGAPGAPRNPVVKAMTPPPPGLSERIALWEPHQLFWIVKHGVKYTAMPAWVALERDDEVWAMTAFLLRLPELDAESYRQLAWGEIDPQPASANVADGQTGDQRLVALDSPLGPELRNCARCHGVDGAGRGTGAFPVLSGQKEEYLLASLKAYAAGERYSGIMQPAAAGLDETRMRALARHYADQSAPARTPDKPDDTQAFALGEALAERGAPENGVPACQSCHGAGQTPRRNPVYPVLDGQPREYLKIQLELLRDGLRGGTPYAHIMHSVARRLSDAQIEALASYYSTRPVPRGEADGG